MTFALSSWAVHRLLDSGTLGWWDLAHESTERGIRRIEICHFHLPGPDAATSDRLRERATGSGVVLQSLLCDFGDLSANGQDLPALLEWVAFARRTGFERVRIIAGEASPTPESTQRSAAALLLCAEAAGPDVRIAIENWKALLPDAAHLNGMLDRLEGKVGLCLDFGNWASPLKERDLPLIAARAETCHAKVRRNGAGEIDREDLTRMVGLLKAVNYDGPYTIVDGGQDEDPWATVTEVRAALLSA